MTKKKKEQKKMVATAQTAPALSQVGPAQAQTPAKMASSKFSLNSWHLIGLSMAIAALLLFSGIGKHRFWDDEANTAVMGQNMLATKSASAWNGLNLLSYGMRGSVDTNLKKTSIPPLQYIIAGISQEIFGRSTIGARMLFVLIGLFTLLFTSLWYKEEFSKERFWPPALILAFTVSFLLYTRQARYYPTAMAFSFAMLYFWAKLPKAKHPFVIGLLALLSGALIAANNYIFAGAIGLTIAASMVRKRYHNKRSYILLGVFVLSTIIASFIVYNYSYGTFIKAFDFSSAHFSRSQNWIFGGLRDMCLFEFVAPGMLIFTLPALFWYFKSKDQRLKEGAKELLIIVFYMAVMLLGCAFFSPQPGGARTVDMLYFIDLIPLGAVAAALIFELLSFGPPKTRPYLGLGFLVILLSSNVLYLSFLDKRYEVRSHLYDYIHEIVAPYPSSTAAVSDYIAANIKPDECLFMVPLYTNITQMFYHPKQKFCGLVTKTAPFVKKHPELRDDLFYENTIPDYFIVGNRNAQNFKALLDYLYGPGSYKLADALPIYWKEATRPEIPWRLFYPRTINNPLNGGVLIFKRTANPAHLPTMPAMEFERYVKF